MSELRRVFMPVFAIMLAISGSEIFPAVAQQRQRRAAPGRAVNPARTRFRFTGTIQRGKKFARPLGDHLTFVLAPMEDGWGIQVLDERLKYDTARLTPPFHGPNPVQIAGWHFRNRDNTGPNVGDMNFPQKIREFIFSPRFEQMIENGDDRYWNDPELVCEAARDGHGVLTIVRMRLGNLVPAQQAWIEEMQFRAEIVMNDSRGRSPWCSRELEGSSSRTERPK